MMIIHVLFWAMSASAHPADPPHSVSVNPRLCEFFLRSTVYEEYTYSLYPDFGYTLFEIFPYDLLYRRPHTFPTVYEELLDAVGLLTLLSDTDKLEKERLTEKIVEFYQDESAPLKGRMVDHLTRQFHLSQTETRRLKYRWNSLDFLDSETRERLGYSVNVNESPIVLLPKEAQVEVLNSLFSHLRSLPNPRAQLLAKRIRFLRQQAEFSRFSLKEVVPAGMIPRTLDGRAAVYPSFFRPYLEEGIEPRVNETAELIWRNFLRVKVEPFLPMDIKDYMKLLDEYIDVMPVE